MCPPGPLNRSGLQKPDYRMIQLIAVSIIWGLSFGLIKAEFSDLSASTLAAARIAIALPCFLPFLNLRRLQNRSTEALSLLAIGAVQYGVMYIALFSAFRYLKGHEVALLTVFTPLYVILMENLFARRRLPLSFWACASLAVAGAIWIFQPDSWPENWRGLLLMQFSNACFAFGQIAYRRNAIARDEPPQKHYALLFSGALIPCLIFLPAASPLSELRALNSTQWAALAYLGSIATGLGFFLWNAGATRVSAVTLAVFNNLKIPIAALIAIFVFREQATFANLLPGLVLMLIALAWAQRTSKAATTDT